MMNMIFVFIYIILGRLIPGAISWWLSFGAPYLIYIGVSTNIVLILFGITNWKNFKKIYCFSCQKCCKICLTEDEVNDSDSENESK